MFSIMNLMNEIIIFVFCVNENKNYIKKYKVSFLKKEWFDIEKILKFIKILLFINQKN